jgi:hypothetical protein
MAANIKLVRGWGVEKLHRRFRLVEDVTHGVVAAEAADVVWIICS